MMQLSAVQLLNCFTKTCGKLCHLRKLSDYSFGGVKKFSAICHDKHGSWKHVSLEG